MKTRIAIFLTALQAATGFVHAQDEPSLTGKTVILPLDEYALVSQPRIDWMNDHLDKAKSDGAARVVFKIDSSGGLAWKTRELVKKITNLGVPTSARIDGDAAGPGALVALACDTIELPDDGKIGGKVSSIPWHGPAANLPQKLVDKTWEDVLPDILTALEPKGLDPEIVRGFIDMEPEISIDGELSDGSSDYTSLKQENAKKVIPFVTAPGELPKDAATLTFEVNDLIAAAEEDEEEAEEEPAPAVEETGEPQEERERKFGETKLESYKDKIVIIEVGDDTLIRSTKFEFMQRVLKKADEDGAEAIILDMDTPGGLAWDTVGIMMDNFAKIDVPTYTFINTKAMSAGALISIATDKIYIHRPGTVGAAGVVSSAGGEIPETYKEKITRFVEAAARGTGNAKGHAKDVAMAFINPDFEVVRDLPTVLDDGSLSLFTRKVINPKGEMLVLDADEAVQRYDGRPVLAEGHATSIDDIIRMEGLKGEKTTARPLGFENVADWIVKLAPFLLLFGMAGAYMEMKTPGFGVPGSIALVCFGLFFFGHSLAGKLAGFELFGILLLGIIFVALELFVFPGLLIFGGLGTLMIVGSLIFAMADKYDFQFEKGEDGSGGPTFGAIVNALETPLFNMALAAGGAIILIILLLRYLPESRAMKWLLLETPPSTGAAITVDGAIAGENSPLLSATGEAVTDLRPAGKGSFGDHGILDIITRGEFVAKGSPIRITEHQGSRIVVEQV